MARGSKSSKQSNGTTLGCKAKLWAAADELAITWTRQNTSILGLIYLKYISNAFEAKHAELDAQRKQGADPEDPRRRAYRLSGTSSRITDCR